MTALVVVVTVLGGGVGAQAVSDFAYRRNRVWVDVVMLAVGLALLVSGAVGIVVR